MQVVIKEEDYEGSIYSTDEWMKSVTIKRWEHDYIKKQYVIDYIEE